MIDIPRPNDPRLLVTSTREPFQPVRLYYSVPSKAAVTNVFRALGCVGPEVGGRSWVWLYQDEARPLTFGVPYGEVPEDVQPIVLGHFRFPETTRMVLQLRSFVRAYEAAKFFGPILGSKVVAQRMRVINRWFKAEEMAQGLDRLDRLLDANVVVIDPMKAETEFEQAMVGANTPRKVLLRQGGTRRRPRRDAAGLRGYREHQRVVSVRRKKPNEVSIPPADVKLVEAAVEHHRHLRGSRRGSG